MSLEDALGIALIWKHAGILGSCCGCFRREHWVGLWAAGVRSRWRQATRHTWRHAHSADRMRCTTARSIRFAALPISVGCAKNRSSLDNANFGGTRKVLKYATYLIVTTNARPTARIRRRDRVPIHNQKQEGGKPCRYSRFHR